MKAIHILFILTILVITDSIWSSSLMPYVGLNRTSSELELGDGKETVTGYELGLEYQWIKSGNLNSASRVTLRNINADSTNLFSTIEVAMNVLSIGQSLEYQVKLGNSILKPFAAFDIGVGFAKVDGDVFGERFESDTELAKYASLSLGLRYDIKKWVPFIEGGYQYAKSKEPKMEESSAGLGELDFSGGFAKIGLGYMF